jgi:hypothetical protein
VEEFKEFVNQFDPDKALGPDRFTLHFYKICCSIIKKYVIHMIRCVQKSYRMGGATNTYFLALIPKNKNATSFNRFLSTSLCNVSYKIIAKIIGNRLNPLLPQLILPNQGGFVEERQIWDLVFNNKEKSMVIGIDMENDFE